MYVKSPTLFFFFLLLLLNCLRLFCSGSKLSFLSFFSAFPDWFPWELSHWYSVDNLVSPISVTLKTFLTFFFLTSIFRHSLSFTLHTNFSASTFNATTNLNNICPCRLKEVFQSNIRVRESLERGWQFQKNLKGELDPEYSPGVKKFCRNWGESMSVHVGLSADHRHNGN